MATRREHRCECHRVDRWTSCPRQRHAYLAGLGRLWVTRGGFLHVLDGLTPEQIAALDRWPRSERQQSYSGQRGRPG